MASVGWSSMASVAPLGFGLRPSSTSLLGWSSMASVSARFRPSAFLDVAPRLNLLRLVLSALHD
jgi:hypothetical protein